MGALLVMGLAGVVIWALSQGGSGGSAEPAPGQVLFEGRFWAPNELRGELRRRIGQVPNARDSLLSTAVAMDFGRDVTPAYNRRFLDAVHAVGLDQLPVETIDSWLAAMREVDLAGEGVYNALAYYASTRSPLADPYAAPSADHSAAIDRARALIPAGTPAQLEAAAREVEPFAPEVAETLRDVAEARRVVEAEVEPEAAPAPAPAPVAAPPPAAEAPLPDRAPDYAAMSTAELGGWSANHLDDLAAWAEVRRRLEASPTANLEAAFRELQAMDASAMTPEARAYLSRTEQLVEEILSARRAGAPVAAPPPPAPAGPPGYDPAAARGEAPALADAIRRAPYASTTTAKVRAFQTHAGLTADGKYGGAAKGALRYYGVANPPNALYRPTAEVAYNPPA